MYTWRCIEIYNCTPELTKVSIHREMPLKFHWTIPVKSTGNVTSLWNMPLTKEVPSENAYPHFARFPRRRFSGAQIFLA